MTNYSDDPVRIMKAAAESQIASLKAALREALDGWAYAINRVASENSSNIQAERIAELRKFLDDK